VKALNVLHLYRVRLRARMLQEVFAVVGIAAGGALLFASQVASSSLSSSVAQLSHGIVGNATLQIVARDPQGFEEHLLTKVRHIPGVRAAAPLVEFSANAVGPRGSESVELVGADGSLSTLGGSLVRHTNLTPFAGFGAVVLPAPLAHKIGVTKFGKEVTFELGGRVAQAALYTQLHAKQIGPLVSSPIAVAPLSFAQEMGGIGAHLSRILVEPAPGREASVRAALVALAAGRLNVEAADFDEKLFARAAAASNQSTALFAVISALVGFLFAFNAMLLTVPQRRRLIADLRRDGYPPRTVIAVMMFDAAVLGVLASVLGLVLGEELSIHLFHSNPGYLSSAFAVGSQRVVSVQSIAIAVLGGMLAASVAVLSPLKDILSRDPLAAITQKEGGSGKADRRLAAGGVVCLAAATAILLAAPKEAILGMVFLVAALLLLLPIPLDATPAPSR
jgi:putative ABC transport system permease protein